MTFIQPKIVLPLAGTWNCPFFILVVFVKLHFSTEIRCFIIRPSHQRNRTRHSSLKCSIYSSFWRKLIFIFIFFWRFFFTFRIFIISFNYWFILWFNRFTLILNIGFDMWFFFLASRLIIFWFRQVFILLDHFLNQWTFRHLSFLLIYGIVVGWIASLFLKQLFPSFDFFHFMFAFNLRIQFVWPEVFFKQILKWNFKIFFNVADHFFQFFEDVPFI